MLKEIKLAHFKSYKSEQSIPLNKLTLLFGPNGGGKSSVIQSIADLKTMLGHKDDYTSLYVSERFSNKSLSSNRYFLKKDEIIRKNYLFDNFNYKSLILDTDVPKFQLLKSKIELIVEKIPAIGLPFRYELREIERSEFNLKDNSTWETVEIDDPTIFLIDSVNDRLIESISKKKSDYAVVSSFLHPNTYYLKKYNRFHPYWFANLSDFQLKYLLRSNWLQAYLNWHDKYDSNEMQYHLDLDSDNQFTLKLNDDSFISGMNRQVFGNHHPYNKYEEFKERIEADKKTNFLFDLISQDEIHPAIHNFCYPFSPIYSDKDINLSKKAEAVEKDTATIPSTNKRPLIFIYNSLIIPPVRKVPKRLRLSDISAAQETDLSTYKKLFNEDSEFIYDSEHPKVILNKYLNALNVRPNIDVISYQSILSSDKLDDAINTGFSQDLFVVLTNTTNEFLISLMEFKESIDSSNVIELQVLIQESVELILQTYKDLDIIDNDFKADTLLDLSGLAIIGIKLLEDPRLEDLNWIRDEAVPKFTILKEIKDHTVEELFSHSYVNNVENEFLEKIKTPSSIYDRCYEELRSVKNPGDDTLLNLTINEFYRTTFESIEYVLHEPGSNRFTRFNETGTGFSQVFPIVINAALHSKRLICVEQPELHLHPALQSNLAPMFIKSVKENKNQFVLETHSEHLIKSVQLEVAKYHQSNGEEGISKDDVSLVYISKDSKTGESVVKEMKLDESGSFIEPWPDDFFESSSDLTYERLKLTNKN